jgi:hypothetical protein
MINLNSKTSIEIATLVKWVVPNFSTAYVTDYQSSVTYDGNTYTNIGNLLNISGTTSELKASPGELTVNLSGIPTGSISDILNQQIKGSSMTIYRSFYNADSHTAYNVVTGSNTVLLYKGIVTNYSITDSVDVEAQLAVSTIILTCNSIVEVLGAKSNGRRTNISDFASDSTMSRVQALAESNFNFGAR